MKASKSRRSDHPVDPMFLERWSPRAFAPETMPKADLLTILEAARWSASAFNIQPWRFVWARRETPDWDRLLGLLVEKNRDWAKNASAIVIVLSDSLRRREGKEDAPSGTHAFDTGLAAASLVLQAQALGWWAHGMEGIDKARTLEEVNAPEGYEVQVAFALGRRGEPDDLPENLREREAPSDRLPLGAIAFEGRMAPPF
ncbi:nitroreductase [Palleronia aestuarii]|uniref:Nitroreductase n=1 Tax=Palleronia aestuarii TaxID=568105 RepID=A0A2W7NUQ4_9RHOB|nr:nitroreductase family protein [Palleronia aestuarii]PZX17086.1 nitroreductase [Palleronia aestuarii]